MKSYIIFVCLTIPWANGQRGRVARQHYNSHGWEIRLAVPGEPGNDYPVLNTIPRTSFTCAKKTPGYYADVEANCQVFRVCTIGSTYSFQSFLCPNGTLFNQAVFVCDWWMNVNCTKSAEYFNNNEKYGSLRIGPQLMIDVTNMLTHSMRTPYDKVVMKNKLVVMQEYKPPSEQPQTNEGYYVKADLNYDNYFTNARQAKKITDENTFNSLDSFVASTNNPRYISSFNAFPPSAPKLIQRYQTQNGLDLHNVKAQDFKNSQTSTFSNGHLVRNSQNIQLPFNTNAQQLQQNQYLTPSNNQRIRAQERGPRNQFLTKQEINKYVSNQTPNQSHQNKHSQAYSQIGIQTKQNSVSIDVPSTIVTKTLTYRKTIPNPKQGQPKSRITFKKWIVKPTRSARLVADPIPYTYSSRSFPAENIIAESSYFYNKPTTDNTIVENSYNKLTTDKSLQNSLSTVPVTQIITTFNENLIPTLPTPTLSSRLYLAPISTIQTKPSLLYLPPTTYKPASFIYIPPSENSKLILRQELSENGARKNSNYENVQSANPLYSLTKQSHVNAKRKNLTFSDILTKEKLDITVNDIVKDTNKIINTASLKQGNNIKQDIRESDSNYLPPDSDNTSNEDIITESPAILSRNSKLIASPSIVLEPPKQSFDEFRQNSNKFSNLPFFKKPALSTNTIERTVSLKITIPEKVADLLFKNQSITQSDNLELLNTGSSNYLVLNKKKTSEAGNNIIPIVRLAWTNNSNFSDSQDLVYSFLADSINSAKQYKNIVQQEFSTSNSSATPTQSNNFENIGQLTNRISDLTSMQYLNYNATTDKQTDSDNRQQSGDTKSYTLQKLFEQKQQRLTQPRQNQLPDNVDENLQINSNDIYSGQLYKLSVPVVTQKIYNAPLLNHFNEQARNYLQTEKNLRVNNNINNMYKEKNKSIEDDIDIDQTPTINTVKSEAYEQQSLNEQDYTDNSLAEEAQSSENRISAHIQDKTVGTIQHPLEQNKQISYNNDKSYIVYAQLNSEGKSNQISKKNIENVGNLYSIHKLPFNSDLSKFLTFQLLPSIGYKLVNEKEQQPRKFNAFEIDEFGRPKQLQLDQNTNQRFVSTADVNYEVNHPKAVTKTQQFNNINTLYDGPSSYYAPQLSVGSLDVTQSTLTDTDRNSKIEELSDTENVTGYGKVTPLKRFSF